MSDRDDWLRLALIPGLGPAGVQALLREWRTPGAILRAPLAPLTAIVGPRVAGAIHAGPIPSALEAALQWVDVPGHMLLALDDPRYPQRLREIPDPPPVLYVLGRTDLLDAPSIAIVGSRHASPQGLRDARTFAQALSAAGWCVTSGLALGIDAAAHAGALGAAGGTIAVVGTGIDISYPRRNSALAEQIAIDGAIVSEFPLGTPPLAGNFPRRNRIISGLARGCLVIEAAIDSGSLITARLAADQGREVFAVPGSIHSPLAKGCHRLIRDGAKLVEGIEDVLEEFGVAVRPVARAAIENSNQGVLAAMGYDPVDIDRLCSQSGLTPDVVSAMLLVLEMEGSVATLPGGRYQRLV